MPAYRIGFGSDFNLVNQLVGIGTTTADVRLEVTNVLKGDFEVSGITTLTSYGGFVPQKQNISLTSSIGFNTTGIGTVGITSFISVNETETGYTSLVGEFNTLSDDLIVDEGKIFEITTTNITGITTIGTQSYDYDTSTVSLGTLESVAVGSHFSVPNGGTSLRPEEPVEGMVRFNDDLNTLEFYNGVEWRQFTVTGASGRGVFGGGDTPTYVATIDTVTISSTGNAVDFGTLTLGRANAGAVASSIRGVWAGGESVPAGAQSNVIDYVTIASAGNAIDFGDLLTASRYRSGCGSSTRGLFGWGSTPGTSNVIEYITINTLGNSLDFGDLLTAAVNNGACSSSTRGVFADSQLSSNSIQFVTIASLGNASYFGELTNTTNYDANRCCSNSIRGINVGGGSFPLISNVIDYITIATTGNAIRFGDLTVARVATSACASQTRGVFAGGHVNPLQQNLIDYVTIATTGNAQDFGDLTSARRETGAVSDSHGGLGGF